MTNYQLTQQDYLDSLNDQLSFLDASLKNFTINEAESKRIATTIRVLIYDTKNSTSLLKHLNKKSSINFINSAPPNNDMLHSMTGMSNVNGAPKSQYLGLVGKINDNGKFLAIPLFKQHLKEWYKRYTHLQFDKWWEMEIISSNGVSLCRKDIVLVVANKDGGAHVDKKLPENYNYVKKTKLTLNISGKEVEFEKNIIYASIAQVGWEIKQSIENSLP